MILRDDGNGFLHIASFQKLAKYGLGDCLHVAGVDPISLYFSQPRRATPTPVPPSLLRQQRRRHPLIPRQTPPRPLNWRPLNRRPNLRLPIHLTRKRRVARKHMQVEQCQEAVTLASHPSASGVAVSSSGNLVTSEVPKVQPRFTQFRTTTSSIS